ncbi:hypothetical protein KKG83_08190 [Candidatus Micrarchaeota archaeon]|nr:hypothetical protein [Candidatus Micrarchaeota archaeon]MBU2477421.1 hypothetical protein [Candidatus Micrarchaeota archaeon]
MAQQLSQYLCSLLYVFYFDVWKFYLLANNPAFIFLVGTILFALIKFLDNRFHFLKYINENLKYPNENESNKKTLEKLRIFFYPTLVVYLIGLFAMHYIKEFTKISYWSSNEAFVVWTAICFVILIVLNFLIKREKTA